jgi:hypothetical protein
VSTGLGSPSRVGPIPSIESRSATTAPRRVPLVLVTSSIAAGTYTTPARSSTLVPLSTTTSWVPADHTTSPAYSPVVAGAIETVAFAVTVMPPSAM